MRWCWDPWSWRCLDPGKGPAIVGAIIAGKHGVSTTAIATSSYEQHGETIAAESVPAPGDDRFRTSQSLFKEERAGFQSNHDPLRLIVFSRVATTWLCFLGRRPNAAEICHRASVVDLGSTTAI